MLKVDMKYVLELNAELLAIPSAAGDCREVLARLEKEFERFGLSVTKNNKGALFAKMEGADAKGARLVGAHADTLGAVVREIKPNGRLRLLPIGGYAWQNFDGENLWVRTSEGAMIRGTLLTDKASRHAFGEECDTFPRTSDTMEVRLDEDVNNPVETRALGIEVGDFVFFDYRLETRPNGYIKSRYLDDKVCIAAMFGAIKAMTEAGRRPTHTVYFNVSNYEELGHGISFVPQDVTECLSLDIGIVAPGTNSSEKAVTIVARDSRTPYDFEFRNRLATLAKRSGIPYRVDTHFRYGSDASLGVIAGKDFNFACIGPGVDASHHYERTHSDAVEGCGNLVLAYICD